MKVGFKSKKCLMVPGNLCQYYWSIPSHGYAGAIAVYDEAYGSGTGLILLDDTFCEGCEYALISCTYAEIGLHDCLHSEDVGVRCQHGKTIAFYTLFVTSNKGLHQGHPKFVLLSYNQFAEDLQLPKSTSELLNMCSV